MPSIAEESLRPVAPQGTGRRRRSTRDVESEQVGTRRLKREVAELPRANKILNSASAVPPRSSTAPQELIAFIDSRRDQFG
jgi:hypothetical protein